jgi:hypothetical protein
MYIVVCSCRRSRMCGLVRVWLYVREVVVVVGGGSCGCGGGRVGGDGMFDGKGECGRVQC